MSKKDRCKGVKRYTERFISKFKRVAVRFHLTSTFFGTGLKR